MCVCRWKKLGKRAHVSPYVAKYFLKISGSIARHHLREFDFTEDIFLSSVKARRRYLLLFLGDFNITNSLNDFRRWWHVLSIGKGNFLSEWIIHTTNVTIEYFFLLLLFVDKTMTRRCYVIKNFFRGKDDDWTFSLFLRLIN